MGVGSVGEWEVTTLKGHTIRESQIDRTNISPWEQLRDRLQEDGDKIVSMRIYVGKLISDCQAKNAQHYFFGRRMTSTMGKGESSAVAHGYFDPQLNAVSIIWCSSDGRSWREFREVEKCQKFLI